ncbi:MAG: glycoside hydrolase family 10 protein, partial [Armatimonadota bacterium]
GWDKCMKILADNGFNAVVPNMLWAGRAYYESKVLPVMPEVGERGDQIAQCVEAGKKYGVQVHPWKVNWNLSGAPEEFVERLRAEGRLQMDRDGNEVRWLCPSNPENFKLELDSMLEVVRNYDVDGVHFDYIRYPHSNSCYCDGCRRRFEESAGVKVANWPADVIDGEHKDVFAKWRQDQITRLVKAVSEQAREIKPHIKISAAVFNNWEVHRFAVGQDWKLWIEEGYLDFVCPMDYTESAESFRSLVTRQVEWVDGKVPLYPGIGVTLGRWTLTGAETIQQAAVARELGADGFMLFNYSEHIANEVAPTLHESFTATKSILPHESPKVAFEFGEGLPDKETLTFAADEPVPVSVAVAAEGPFDKKVVRARGEVYLETVEGRRLQKVGECSSEGQPAKPELRLEPGKYRLALEGTVSFEGGTKQKFLRRSRPFAVSE